MHIRALLYTIIFTLSSHARVCEKTWNFIKFVFETRITYKCPEKESI